MTAVSSTALRYVRDPRAVAAALATVLMAALVALSTHLGAEPDARLQTMGPHIDRLVVNRAFLVDEDAPPARHAPCRVSRLLGADLDKTWSGTYVGSLPTGGRLVEVSVYRLPDPVRRITQASEGLQRCGTARSGRFTLRYLDFTTSGDVVTWRFDAESPDVRSAGLARLFPVGEYVVYVADQWQTGEPGVYLMDDLTAEIASIIVQYG